MSSLVLRLAALGAASLGVYACLGRAHEGPSSSPTASMSATNTASTTTTTSATIAPVTTEPVAPTPASPSLASEGSSASSIEVAETIRERCELPDDEDSAPRFSAGSAELEAGGAGIVERVAECLTIGPLAGARVRVVGRTDSLGSEEANMEIGARRAEVTRDLLIRRGVAPARIDVTSLGESQATGVDDESRARDRRVEIQLADTGRSERKPR
jgi:outer membrane protein OmpA-like peptidoglycan-associated protein